MSAADLTVEAGGDAGDSMSDGDGADSGEMSDDGASDEEGSGDEAPGFGAVLTLVALIAVALVARRHT